MKGSVSFDIKVVLLIALTSLFGGAVNAVEPGPHCVQSIEAALKGIEGPHPLEQSTQLEPIPTASEFDSLIHSSLEHSSLRLVDEQVREKAIDQLIAERDPEHRLPATAMGLAKAYMQSARWQEAVWTLKRSGLVSYGSKLEEVLLKWMETGPIEFGTGIPGSKQVVQRGSIDIGNGQKLPIIIKYQKEILTKREIWAYRINNILNMNLVPLVTERRLNVRPFSVHLEVPKATDYGFSFRDHGYKKEYPDIYLLDYLIANTDRHSRNSMLTFSHRLFGIDHGLGFYDYDTYANIVDYKGHSIPPSPLVLQRVKHLTVDQFKALLPKDFPERQILVIGDYRYKNVREIFKDSPVQPISEH